MYWKHRDYNRKNLLSSRERWGKQLRPAKAFPLKQKIRSQWPSSTTLWSLPKKGVGEGGCTDNIFKVIFDDIKKSFLHDQGWNKTEATTGNDNRGKDSFLLTKGGQELEQLIPVVFWCLHRPDRQPAVVLLTFPKAQLKSRWFIPIEQDAVNEV